MTSSSNDVIRFLENCANFRYDTSTNNEDRTVCVCVCVWGGGEGGGASTKHIHVKRPSPIKVKSIVMYVRVWKSSQCVKPIVKSHVKMVKQHCRPDRVLRSTAMDPALTRNVIPVGQQCLIQKPVVYWLDLIHLS